MYCFEGGYDHCDGSYLTQQTAAKFDGAWNKISSLIVPRQGHRSILIGKDVIHIGGKNENDERLVAIEPIMDS